MKPDSQMILEMAKEYLGSWAMSITPEMINVARHKASVYRVQPTNDEDGMLRISGANEESIPTFNTRAGEEVSVPVGSVIPVPVDHPTYILQWIRIGNYPVMIFYERETSLNLIQGDIAEREGLPLVCDSPRKLRVGGGLEIDTVYGICKVLIGPSTTGEYTEITCRGLSVLTEHFPEHSLEELDEEVYNARIVDRSVPLPKKLGGVEVGLLLGITSTRIDPVLVHTLPNGLGSTGPRLWISMDPNLLMVGPIRFSPEADLRVTINCWDLW